MPFFCVAISLMETGSLDLVWLAPLLLTGVVAGFIDTIAGGGGLITLPVLLSCGFSPQDALGTNKFQASFGSGSATWHFARAGWIDFRASKMGIACTAAGTLTGSWVVQQFPPEFLRIVIPGLLLGIVILMVVRPSVGEQETSPRMHPAVFQVLAGLSLGFYDGFFGPGTGTFWAMAFVLAQGYGLARATAHTKLMNFTSNIGSLAVFALTGHVWLLAGLVMAIGQVVGAKAASGAVLKSGTALIRPVFLVVVVALAMRLLWQAFMGR